DLAQGSGAGSHSAIDSTDVAHGPAASVSILDSDPAREGMQSWEALIPVTTEEVQGHAPHGRSVSYFSGGGAFGGGECCVTLFGAAPLVVGAGDIDPVAALAFGSGDGSWADGGGVLDGPAVVAEDLGDADVVESDVGGAEGGVPVVGVVAEFHGG